MMAAKDIISNMPDSLLHHIHSFLEIKDAARTSVLSKRWNHIWNTVPTLEFHNYTHSPSNIQKFMNFVDGTLHRHNSSNIDKFVLDCNHELDESRVHSWISTVVRGHVKELRLNLFQEYYSSFIPLSLFTSESLTSLELDTGPNIRLPKNICFPRLKQLKLCYFEFSNECWNEELFSNSPILEELILEHCRFNVILFCISIPTLKLLEIRNCAIEEGSLGDCICKIHAPRLVTFSYAGYSAKEFVLSSFQALAEATVTFHDRNNDCAKEINRLLRAFAHVKCLTVDDKTLQAICSAYNQSNNLLLFHNVKMLKISDELTTDEGLVDLLKAVPNLELLVFVKYMDDEKEEYSYEEVESSNDEGDSDEAVGSYEEVESSNDEGDGDDDDDEGENNDDNEDEGNVPGAAEYDEDSWALDSATTGCLFPHLKSVSFEWFVGNPREIRWVKLILTNAKALQMMTVRYGDDPGMTFVDEISEEELVEEIQSFPRTSLGCVIKVHSRDGKLVTIH